MMPGRLGGPLRPAHVTGKQNTLALRRLRDGGSTPSGVCWLDDRDFSATARACVLLFDESIPEKFDASGAEVVLVYPVSDGWPWDVCDPGFNLQPRSGMLAIE